MSLGHATADQRLELVPCSHQSAAMRWFQGIAGTAASLHPTSDLPSVLAFLETLEALVCDPVWRERQIRATDSGDRALVKSVTCQHVSNDNIQSGLQERDELLRARR